MPLKWKTTTIGKTTITHWEKHDAAAILKMLDTKPIEVVGRTPPLERHVFGPYEVAVRWFGDFSERLFDLLRAMIEVRCAIVEMPLAFVRSPDSQVIVTLWKKKARNLFFELRDKKMDGEEGVKLYLRAVRHIARLNAFDFVHGHVLGNTIVTGSGQPGLVDYSRIFRCTERWLGQEIRIGNIVTICFHNTSVDQRREIELRLGKVFDKEYDYWLNFYAKVRSRAGHQHASPSPAEQPYDSF